MKLLFFILTFSIILIYSFLNLGSFLDVTEQPSKTDLIVSLGGNGISRLNKAISLVEKNYTKNNIIIVTGYEGTNRTKENNIPDARLDIIKDLKNKNKKFILNPDLKNTAEEIIFVKEYMKNNDLKDVTFVTEPPHSRRILLLANILVKGGYK